MPVLQITEAVFSRQINKCRNPTKFQVKLWPRKVSLTAVFIQRWELNLTSAQKSPVAIFTEIVLNATASFEDLQTWQTPFCLMRRSQITIIVVNAKSRVIFMSLRDCTQPEVHYLIWRSAEVWQV